MERSDEQKKCQALWDIYGVSNNLYTITLVPKGKGKTHQELLAEFQTEIEQLKCVLSYWLVKETETTNHFHGMIQTKSPCKFFRFKSKKSLVNAYIQEFKPHFNKSWAQYCAKGNPKSFLKWHV